MNTIFIADLKVETRIGIYDWEQRLKQPLLLNLEIEPPSAAAFVSDSFADALDYAAVVARVKAFAADHPHKLLERFAAGALRVTGETPTQLRAGVMHIRAWLAFDSGDVDAAAAWLARADEDVSTVRDELRAHRRAINALREDHVEFTQEMSAFRSEMYAFRDDTQRQFSMVKAGLETIIGLLERPGG